MVFREIVSLLETGGDEFRKGNPSAGMSILFEAQCLLSEIVQRQAEMMQGPASEVACLGLRQAVNEKPQPVSASGGG